MGMPEFEVSQSGDQASPNTIGTGDIWDAFRMAAYGPISAQTAEQRGYKSHGSLDTPASKALDAPPDRDISPEGSQDMRKVLKTGDLLIRKAKENPIDGNAETLHLSNGDKLDAYETISDRFRDARRYYDNLALETKSGTTIKMVNELDYLDAKQKIEVTKPDGGKNVYDFEHGPVQVQDGKNLITISKDDKGVISINYSGADNKTIEIKNGQFLSVASKVILKEPDETMHSH